MIERTVFTHIEKIEHPALRRVADILARLVLENWLYFLILLLLWRFPYLVAALTDTEVAPTRFVRAGESVFWQSELAQALVIACLAMSYNLLFGFSGIVSFGHALFFGAGAYLTFILMIQLDFSFYQAVGLAVLGCMALSLLSGVVTLRLRGVYFAMFTLAMAEVFVVLVRSATWVEITGGGDGLPLRDLFESGRIPADLIATPRPAEGQPLFNRLHMYQITVVFFALTFLAIRRYLNSPTGRVMVAIRENEQRARTIGYNTFYYKLITMMFAGAIASLSGILFVLWGADKQVKPDYLGITYTVVPLLYTLIGGVGTLTGPVLAALGLELGETYFYNEHISLGQRVEVLSLSFGTLWQWMVVVLLAGVLWFVRQQVGRAVDRLTLEGDRARRAAAGGLALVALVSGWLIAGELGDVWKLHEQSYLVSDIWQLFLGTVFVIVVMVLPHGIVGTWNLWRVRRRIRHLERELQKH